MSEQFDAVVVGAGPAGEVAVNALDIGYHLAYGLAAAGAYRALERM